MSIYFLLDIDWEILTSDPNGGATSSSGLSSKELFTTKEWFYLFTVWLLPRPDSYYKSVMFHDFAFKVSWKEEVALATDTPYTSERGVPVGWGGREDGFVRSNCSQSVRTVSFITIIVNFAASFLAASKKKANLKLTQEYAWNCGFFKKKNFWGSKCLPWGSVLPWQYAGNGMHRTKGGAPLVSLIGNK